MTPDDMREEILQLYDNLRRIQSAQDHEVQHYRNRIAKLKEQLIRDAIKEPVE